MLLVNSNFNIVFENHVYNGFLLKRKNRKTEYGSREVNKNDEKLYNKSEGVVFKTIVDEYETKKARMKLWKILIKIKHTDDIYT